MGNKPGFGAFICEHLPHSQWLMGLQMARGCVCPPAIGELYHPAWFASSKFVQITLKASRENCGWMFS